jgi:hypothetical protein
MKISKLQIVEPQHWSGLTRKSHLAAAGMTQPQYVDKVMDRLYEVNYGADNFVSFINQFPVHTIDAEGEYRWRLHGADERNVPLAQAESVIGTVVVAGDRLGLAHSQFYMTFSERWFDATSVIVGPNPDAYALRVVEDPVPAGQGWRYKVELVTGDENLFVPVADLQRGTLWSEDYALVEQYLSKRGASVRHTSPFEMENTTSMIRRNYEVAGAMISEGKNHPLAFAFIDGKGNTQTAWLNKLEWDFYTQCRRDKARLLMFGKSNKKLDGTYANKGESGNTISAGYGLLEQTEGGNILQYNKFDLDTLTKFALDISVGKVPGDKRKLVLSTGEYGMYEFHKAASEKASGLRWLQSGHNFKTNGGKVQLDEGQIMSYVGVNGIEFHLMLDPTKDDNVRYKQQHPDGGLIQSRVYDIWDFGTTNGKSNIQRVSVKDQEEFFRYIPGMRDPFSPGGKGENPTMTASSVDGYSVYKMFIGGIMVRNPFKTGRLIPAIV